MGSPTLRLFILAVALAGAVPAAAGPYVVGDRLFPATPTVDDPFVADAFELGANTLRQRSTLSDPAFRQTNFGFGAEQRLTANLGVSVQGAYTINAVDGAPDTYGFQNFDATLKYQLVTSDAHEFLLTLGVEREFGGTGARRVGAEPVGSTAPTVYFGKGLGDLPDPLKYLRPLAVTGTAGYQFADRHSRGDDHFPDQGTFGVSVQYSLRYLQGNVEYVGLPAFVGRLTPLVEFSYATPLTRSYGTPSTGLVAPGIIYSEDGIDFGIEALLPATRLSGTGVGAIALLHVPLERLLPALGQPLFGD